VARAGNLLITNLKARRGEGGIKKEKVEELLQNI
jgi:hypothetical protein